MAGGDRRETAADSWEQGSQTGDRGLTSKPNSEGRGIRTRPLPSLDSDEDRFLGV